MGFWVLGFRVLGLRAWMGLGFSGLWERMRGGLRFRVASWVLRCLGFQGIHRAFDVCFILDFDSPTRTLSFVAEEGNVVLEFPRLGTLR